jgi:hypothetical protein
MKLEDINKKNPFLIPEGYFENLSDNIMLKIEKEKKRTKVLKLNLYLKRAISIAAILLISLFITQTNNNYDNVDSYEYDLSGDELLSLFTTSEIEDYIMSEYYYDEY